MSRTSLPEQVSVIEPGESFFFLCHKNVRCFTDCCRELELALTPYDILRLRRATGLTSTELHQRVIIEEQSADSGFPSFYLTMVDDGKASCVFVTPEGCSIYADRPGACRTYPLGRGVMKRGTELTEQFVILKEPHCHGFAEKTIQTVSSFMQSQEMEPYNRFNDLLADIIHHEKIAAGMKLTDDQYRIYRLALFDLDAFRTQLHEKSIDSPLAVPGQIADDDEALLEFGMQFVKIYLFD